MFQIVQVKLREWGEKRPFTVGGLTPKPGDVVIIEQEKGFDYGEVVSEFENIHKKKLSENLCSIVRIANEEDLKQIKKNKKKARESMVTCEAKIIEHRLEMKLIDAEYAFDRSKIIFYFTADGRVDFRDLVKNLANIFRVRIELKQVGVRDEARLLGGFGPCGRRLCCASFLRDFEPVTIRMAKDQNLPLNPTKISGVCGRLMCCLQYENKMYKTLLRGMPREGRIIETDEGKGRVIGRNPLKRTVTVELEGKRQIEVKV